VRYERGARLEYASCWGVRVLARCIACGYEWGQAHPEPCPKCGGRHAYRVVDCLACGGRGYTVAYVRGIGNGGERTYPCAECRK
jgi:rubrerythrin